MHQEFHAALKTLACDDPDVASTQGNIGIMPQTQEKHPEALKVHEKVLKTHASVLGPGSKVHLPQQIIIRMMQSRCMNMRPSASPKSQGVWRNS